MLKPSVNKQDNVSGPDTALITLVEYGDYECSYCGRAYGIIKNIQKKLGNNLRFIFRNFPIQESHPDAYKAAVAAEAAARQDAFWPMHDELYENQDRLNDEDLAGYTGRLKLNLKTFNNDIKDKAVLQKVEGDLESGIRSGVNGTPSFFINGIRYDGSWEENDLLNALNAVSDKSHAHT